MTDHCSFRFLLIDDDPICNLIPGKLIKGVFPGADIKPVTNPEAGLDYIQTNYNLPHTCKTTIFLDINMPVLDGWGVLDLFDNFSSTVKQHFKIIVLSSSIAINDRQRARDNPCVVDFIVKPLTVHYLQNLQTF